MHLTRLAALAAALLFASVAPAAAQGWGALAFSENGTAYAYSRNYQTREQAMQGAIGECAKHASDCKVYATFQNKCVALAGASNGAYGWAIGGTSDAAREAAAMRQCQQQGGPDCRMVVKFCSGVDGDSPVQPPPQQQPPAQPPGQQPNPKE
jgi:hypothetical protein